jgi:hypothetical protein
MQDDLVQRCVHALQEAETSTSTYNDLACAVLEVALPTILEAAAATARLQILRSSNIERRTRGLGIRREPLCTEYAEEAADAILSLLHARNYEAQPTKP